MRLSAGPVGPPPEFLTGDALDEWTRLTSDPEFSAALAPAHRAALIEYCGLCAKMYAAIRGDRPTDPQTALFGAQTPKVEMTSAERYALQKLRTDLGLTPAAQSKVRVSAPPQEKKSKWAGL